MFKYRQQIIIAIIAAAVAGFGTYAYMHRKQEQLQKDLAVATGRQHKPPVPPQKATGPTDSDLVKNLAKADYDADPANRINVPTIKTEKVSGNFGKASVNAAGKTYFVMARRIDSLWVIIAKGPAAPTPADATRFQIPASF